MKEVQKEGYLVEESMVSCIFDKSRRRLVGHLYIFMHRILMSNVHSEYNILTATDVYC